MVNRAKDGLKVTELKVVELSDEVIITVQDETSNEVADMLVQNRDSTFDKIVRNILDATATQLDAIHGANGLAPTEVTESDLERILEGIVGANGKPMAPMIEGKNKFGTAPIMKSFWGIMHTDLRPDIRGLSSFVRTSNYPSQDAVLTNEFGNTNEIRWVSSTEATKTVAADPIYRLKVTAANAYGVIPVTEVSNEMIIKPLGAGDDPLNQRQTMGWKSKLGGVILDDSWIRILNVTKK